MKNKLTLEEKIRVIIDSNEPPRIYDECVEYFPKDIFVMERAPLPVGDLDCCGICIERKTISDLLSTITRRERARIFWKNLVIMREDYSIPILFIEGSETDFIKAFSHSRHPNPLGLFNGLLATLFTMHIEVYKADTLKNGIEFFKILFINNREKISPSRDSLLNKKKKKNWKQLRTLSLTAIPGIGASTAHKIYNDNDPLIQFILQSKGIDEDLIKKIIYHVGPPAISSSEKLIRNFFWGVSEEE